MSIYPEPDCGTSEGLIDIRLMTKRRRCDDNWRLSCIMAVCFFAGLLLAVFCLPA